MPFKQIAIIDVQPAGPIADIGKDAAKRLPPGARYRYSRPVIYKLQDGREVPGTLRALTRPQLAERLENTQDHIRRRMLFREWDDAGNEWNTLSCQIGPGITTVTRR